MDIEWVGRLAKTAGEEILSIYRTDFSVTRKEDDSPLTLADRRSHEIIENGLRKKYPEIPLLSEEGRMIPFERRKNWRKFWLVDPLDGTKEFIRKNGEFTVNIALINGNRPEAGVIYAPVYDRLYIADSDGARLVEKDRVTTLSCSSCAKGPLRVVQSRSHPSSELTEFLRNLPEHVTVEKGSSLKFCIVAEGKADLYPRLGPTWEWDTAAGHAVLNAAGGMVTDLSGKPVSYNKKDLLNGHFIAASGPFLQGAAGKT